MATSVLDVVTTMLDVFPKSLLACWQAASPSILGIECIHSIAGAQTEAGFGNPPAFVTPSAVVAA